MKLSFFATAAFGLSLLFTSCHSSKTSISEGVNGEWNVITLNAEEITPSENTPVLGFDKKRSAIYGFTGCNRLTGRYNTADLNKGMIDFAALGCTRMLCHDDKYETKFLKTLGDVKTLKTQGSKMILLDKDGKTIVVLKKK
ncbi:MAG: META domain-containing protein [Bacteroidaceae bacterium]